MPIYTPAPLPLRVLARLCAIVTIASFVFAASVYVSLHVNEKTCSGVISHHPFFSSASHTAALNATTTTTIVLYYLFRDISVCRHSIVFPTLSGNVIRSWFLVSHAPPTPPSLYISYTFIFTASASLSLRTKPCRNVMRRWFVVSMTCMYALPASLIILHRHNHH